MRLDFSNFSAGSVTGIEALAPVKTVPVVQASLVAGSMRPASFVTVPIQPWQAELVCGFMEVDSMTLAEAQAAAVLSVQARPVDEWLSMISELDVLVARYCSAAELSVAVRSSILAARCRQSLAAIPETLEWLRREVVSMAGSTLTSGAEHESNFEGSPGAKAARLSMQQPFTKESKQ